MTKLEYRLTNDILFRLLFTKYPDLLKRLIAALLGITYDSIEQFLITNQDMPPEEMGKKFCRLDINMIVDGKHINLEVQVENEGNYPERSLYYWAREFSNALNEGQNYGLLPRTIVISILGFNQFTDPKKFHSEFQVLEVTSHEALTDKCALHFYELPKLSEQISTDSTDNSKELWLRLFKAETEEDLAKIEALEVSVMSEAIRAYRHVAASPEFKEIERVRSKARHDEAQAIHNAELREREKWQGVAAENAELRAKLAELQAQINKN